MPSAAGRPVPPGGRRPATRTPGRRPVHPSGFPHGPHPRAFAAGAKAAKTMTDEVAVMIDARDGLDLARGAQATEDQAYADSWKPK